MSNEDKKAKELIERFMPHAESEYADSTAMMRGAHMKHAKACALICVEEILNSGINDVAKNLYWSTVKTSILNHK